MKGRLALILLLAALARGYALTRPWAPGDHNGWGGAFYSNIARNYLRYGYLETRLAPVVTTGEAPEERRVYYLTHPPLIGLSVSFAFRILGEREWAARLVPLAFSLGSVALVYLLGSALWSDRAGILAAVFFALIPMGVVYGAHVDPQGPPVVFFSLALLEAYRRRSIGIAMAALVLGAGFDWPVHYLAGLLALHSLLTSRFRERRGLALPIASAFLIGGFLFYAREVAPRPEQNYLGESAIDSFSFWSGSQVDPRRIPGYPLREPSLTQWARRMSGYYRELFTLPLLGLATIGIGVARQRRKASFLLILLGWGSMHVALFPMGAFVHDYWSVYLAPGLSLAAALGALWIDERMARLSVPATARRAVAAAALAGLGGFWLFVAMGRIERSRGEESSLGKKLHQLARPGEGILSLLPVDIRDAYYADRPIREGVNRWALFEEAKSDTHFRYRYFVVPQSLVSERPEKPLFQHLESRYSRILFQGFYIYDLASGRPGASLYGLFPLAEHGGGGRRLARRKLNQEREE